MKSTPAIAFSSAKNCDLLAGCFRRVGLQAIVENKPGRGWGNFMVPFPERQRLVLWLLRSLLVLPGMSVL
ncbi:MULTISPECIES: hypothetical protein [unclassified Coleofasciculus]|uniref:hypothetical protein n=1 Tax=Cyanophyceae TaxID=3028117 RepID=UPI001686CFFD|nr:MULTISPECIES: hypothetical protein [unclassified Coleofasciculus]MBD1841332.1 hypothetical protein [Coleofasciculus sp. FACHB-501]MBD1887910.1 hypothetical protein [Coleofasciculus sp. FACHB-SPT9]MBD1901502.1 hypothetical protein [Coleofasciculus sp. FACHB-125]MBD2084886.1 hypothetical protein [Coleofasciculus sp. FACHB-542]